MADKLDAILSKVEDALLEHQQLRLQRWAERQHLALGRAAKVEQAAFAKNSSITAGVVAGLREELEARDAERQRMREHTQQVKEDCDQHFQRELRRLRRGQRVWAKELLQQQCTRLADSLEETLAAKWQHLEETLQRSLWDYYTEAQRRGLGRVLGTSNPEDLKEVWQNGELKSILVTEKQGWGRSQRADLQHLQEEMDREHQRALEGLEKKISISEPEALQQLRALAGDAKKQLEHITAEVQSSLPELESAWKACEQDYEQREAELQQVQAQVARQRFQDMETLRQLKLQLLRWRLDFQRAFHAAPAAPAGAEKALKRFVEVRRVARGLWAQMPLKEAHAFMAEVAQAAARAGASDGMLKAYEKELRRVGALPLVSHAASPELLRCWTDACEDS